MEPTNIVVSTRSVYRRHQDSPRVLSLLPLPDAPFITSPECFADIISSATISPPDVILLNSLDEVLNRWPYNAAAVLLCSDADNPLSIHRGGEIVKTLISKLFDFLATSPTSSRDHAFPRAGLKLLHTFLQVWSPSRHHYEAVCQNMRGQSDNSEKALFGLEIIQTFSRCPQPRDSVASYFFFSPGSSLTVSFPADQRGFPQGYTFIAWVRPAIVPGGVKRLKMFKDPCLLRVVSEKGVVEYGLEGGELRYRRQDVTRTAETPLGKLKEEEWNFVAVSCNRTTGKLNIVINEKNVAVPVVIKHPGETIETIHMFDKFIGQVSGTIFYSAPLPVTQIIQQIRDKFPQGLSDLAFESSGIPAEGIRFAYSPARVSARKVQNIAAMKGSPEGKLNGNCGTIKFPTETMKIKYLFPLENLLPTLQLSRRNLLESVLETARVGIGNLHRFAEGNIRLRKEGKAFARGLGFLLPQTDPGLVSVRAIELICEIAALDPTFGGLVLHRKTAPAIQTHYWTLLSAGRPYLTRGGISSDLLLAQTLETLCKFPCPDNCQRYTQTGLTTFLTSLVQQSSMPGVNRCLSVIFSKLLKPEESNMCLFTSLIEVLTAWLRSHPELCPSVISLYSSLAPNSVSARVSCINLLGVLTSAPGNADLKRSVWKTTVTEKGDDKTTGEEKLPEENKKKRRDAHSQYLDLGELEKKVAEEAANIRGAIRDIHRVKSDIQSFQKPNTGFDAKPEKGESLLDSEAVSIIPQPPPAPRRGGKFNFSLSPHNTISLAGDDNKAESKGEPEEVEEEPKRKPTMMKKKLMGLAINTEEINKEFNCGGEKGQKLVDEAEELRKFETEVLDLAQRCVDAMTREENRITPAKKSQFDFQSDEKGKEDDSRLLECLVKSLVGGEGTSHEITNPHVLPALARFARRTAFDSDRLDPILGVLTRLQPEDELLKDENCVLPALMKLQQLHKLFSVSTQQSLTLFHAKLLLRRITTSSVPFSLLKRIDNPACLQAIKAVSGKVLELAGLADLSIDALGTLTELTLVQMVHTIDSSGKIAISAMASVGSYADTEIIATLFSILELKLWAKTETTIKECGLIESKCFAEPEPGHNLGTLTKGERSLNFPNAVALLICFAIAAARNSVEEAGKCIRTLEKAAKYMLLLLEARSKSGRPQTALEESVTLMVGYLVKLSQTDSSSLPEVCELCHKTATGLIGYMLQMSPRLQVLAKRLCPEAGELSAPESNYHIAKELEKLDRPYLETLRREIKNRVRLESARKSDVAESLSAVLKYKSRKFIRGRHKELDTRRILLDEGLPPIKSALVQQIAIPDLLRKNAAKVKWRRLLSRLSQWQGAWRDPRLFDTEEGRNVPLRLSSHRFANGSRCVLKARDKYSKRFLKDADAYSPEDARVGDLEDLPNDESSADPEMNCERIAETLYNSMEKKLRDKLLAPIKAEIYGGLCADSGTVMLMYKSQTREAYLIFVRRLLGKRRLPEEDARLMFSCPLRADNRRIVKKWRLGDINKILRKRIVERKSGLELEFYNGKYLLLNFDSEDKRDSLSSKLVRLREKWCRGLQYSGTVDPARDFDKGEFADLWCERRISTLDYLMLVNQHSCRSFDNLSQYPVFPWILIGETQQATYRDLTKNMGMSGDAERAEEYKKRYAQEDLAGLGRFHFGSHYSNPGIVLQYTMRLFPAFEGYVKFFSGLDDPNRMFHSVQDTYINATKDLSDVREAIPEFYTLPEMFINRERLMLGQRGKGKEEEEKVDSVKLPKWADGNAYKYVAVLREALESDETSEGLPTWIDLVFGYQQRGKHAEKAFNLFPPVSYDPARILATARNDPQLYEAYRVQAYHWGQTPQQLFQRKHPRRKKEAGRNSLWEKGMMAGIQIQVLKDAGHAKIVRILLCQSQTSVSFVAVGINGQVQQGSVSSSHKITFSPPEKYDTNYVSPNSCWTRSALVESYQFPLAILTSRKVRYVAQGGYCDGAIQLTPLQPAKKATFTLFYHASTVTCVEVAPSERIALVGTAGGDCAVYGVEDDMFWRPRDVLGDHSGEITSISISEEMRLFVTAGIDGTANIYGLDYKPVLVRTVKPKARRPLNWAGLAAAPVPCVVVYSREERLFSCYSINGEPLCEVTESCTEIVSPVIVRDGRFSCHLVYLARLSPTGNNKLTKRKLPLLEEESIPCNENITVLAPSPDQSFVLAGCADGTLAILTHNPESVLTH